MSPGLRSPSNEEFGVLVVGAGAAGSVLAARLAERGVEVGLIEAGPDWRPHELPEELRRPWQSFAWSVPEIPPRFHWPDVAARRFPDEDPRLYIRGRGLGGSTTVNGLIMLRPPLSEFDAWPVSGAMWGTQAALAGFRRLEDDRDYPTAPLHSGAGKMSISRLPQDEWGTADELVLEAARALGHEWIDDLNGMGEDGIGRTPLSIVDGTRVTANDAFIEPARATGHVHVLSETLVDRVIFEESRAVGVAAVSAGRAVVWRSPRIVLAAGALMTPAVLQRSGVGPHGLLSRLGIDTIADLPVGRAAQEHLGMKFAGRIPGAVPAGNGTRGNVLVRYSSGLTGFGQGDLIIGMTNVDGSTEEMTLIMKLVQCHSRGVVEVAGTDPAQAPRVELNLLGDERDRRIARRGYADLFELARQEPLAARLDGLRGEDGAALPDPRDVAAVDGWLRAHVSDTAHLSCTAPLGTAGDGRSVVDDHCRVHGVDGLWVGDLSITPAVPRANTQLTAMMIGERVSDLLGV